MYPVGSKVWVSWHQCELLDDALTKPPSPAPDLVEELVKVLEDNIPCRGLASAKQPIRAILDYLEAKGWRSGDGIDFLYKALDKAQKSFDAMDKMCAKEMSRSLRLLDERSKRPHRFTTEEFEALKREIRFSAIAEKLDLPPTFSNRRLLSGEFMMEGDQLVLVKDHDRKLVGTAIDMWSRGSRGDWYAMARSALFAALNLTKKEPSDV